MEHSDVTLVVCGRPFTVNKELLTRSSPYFQAMLCGNFRESRENIVEIQGVDNPESFSVLLSYITKGHITMKADGTVLSEVLDLADMFNLENFCEHLQTKLLKSWFKTRDLNLLLNLADRVEKKDLLIEVVLQETGGLLLYMGERLNTVSSPGPLAPSYQIFRPLDEDDEVGGNSFINKRLECISTALLNEIVSLSQFQHSLSKIDLYEHTIIVLGIFYWCLKCECTEEEVSSLFSGIKVDILPFPILAKQLEAAKEWFKNNDLVCHTINTLTGGHRGLIEKYLMKVKIGCLTKRNEGILMKFDTEEWRWSVESNTQSLPYTFSDSFLTDEMWCMMAVHGGEYKYYALTLNQTESTRNQRRTRSCYNQKVICSHLLNQLDRDVGMRHYSSMQSTLARQNRYCTPAVLFKGCMYCTGVESRIVGPETIRAKFNIYRYDPKCPEEPPSVFGRGSISEIITQSKPHFESQLLQENERLHCFVCLGFESRNWKLCYYSLDLQKGYEQPARIVIVPFYPPNQKLFPVSAALVDCGILLIFSYAPGDFLVTFYKPEGNVLQVLGFLPSVDLIAKCYHSVFLCQGFTSVNVMDTCLSSEEYEPNFSIKIEDLNRNRFLY